MNQQNGENRSRAFLAAVGQEFGGRAAPALLKRGQPKVYAVVATEAKARRKTRRRVILVGSRVAATAGAALWNRVHRGVSKDRAKVVPVRYAVAG